MRILLVALFVVLTLSVLVPASPAEAHSGKYVVTGGNGLNLRTKPSNGRIIEVIPYGAIVEAHKHRGNWMFLTYDGEQGWASLTYLAKYKAPRARSSCFDNTWGEVVCAPGWISDAIYSAAAYYGVSSWLMLSIAACESNFDPSTVGWAGEIGIFQWLPSTWDWIGQGSIWDTWDQAYSTAWALANGYASHWTCYWRVA